jgi:hypothetical protein
MAISDNQKVDYLWKKLGYALTKTDTNTQKKAPNESIPSPLQLRGDKVMKQSSSIPGVIPGSTSGVVTVYPTSNPVECAADITATPNRSWKTNLENWISPEFGSTYQVKVYIHDTSDAANATTGDQVFATGTGNDDEWFFDYQSGVLHFIGDNLPNGVSFTGKTVYISGARYTGQFGVGGDTGDFVFTDNEISLLDSNDTIVFDATTGLVLPVGATADRSGTPQQGEIRFNSSSNEVEVFTGSSWETVGSGGSSATFDSQTINGDGTTDTFTLLEEVTADAIIVVIGGTVQTPNSAYSVTADQITFAEPPLSTDEVIIRYVASGRVVTGLYSPDTTNNVNVQNSDIALSINSTDIVTVTSSTIDLAAEVDLNSNKIINLLDPTNNQDAATKAYVDGTLSANLASLLTITDGTTSTALGDDATLEFAGTSNETTVVNTAGVITIGLPDTISVNVTGNVTGNLTGNVAGNLTGNAATATKWATARTLSLTGAVTGSASIDGSGNVSIVTSPTNDPILTIDGDASGTATFTDLGDATLTLTVLDNSHNHTIANITGLQDALDEVANADSPAFTGTPTAPTATSGTNTTQIATTAFVTGAISDLVESAPSTLDTLNELAAALGDDPNFATTISTNLGNKVDKTSAQALGTAADVLTVSNDTITLARGNGTSDSVTVNNVANATASTTATRLATSRTIALSGDVTGSASFDGSANATITADISNSGVTAGTYGSSTAIPVVTVAADGRITAASTSSITVGDGTLTMGTSGNGITGSQTFSANQGTNATFTVTSNATSANTASTIVFRDSNGDFSAGTITADTFDGTATSAEYADLAERYVADQEYEVGTVMAVGGDAEVTAATTALAHSVLGVISANPAYLMNKGLDGATIALKGRVPVRVEGQVNKGDRLAPSQTPGVAEANNDKSAWSFAIALESGTGIVEAVIL